MTANRTGVQLSAHRVCKQFGSLVVLDGIDFHLRENEAVGIVGPNGAGKTTLFSVLTGAHMPSSGAIEFGGKDITSAPVENRCRMGIVRTHQIPRPFGAMSVFENVFVAASNGGGFKGSRADERSIAAIDRCGMIKVANRRADTLGLLDRKRLELARALAVDPAVLLLDEIAGGLTDAEAGVLVETILRLRRQGVAIVWIEHIVHVLLRVVTRLICMDAGRIIADGDPRAVMADKAVMSAYLGGPTR